MFSLMRSILLLTIFLGIGVPAWASAASWEYKVIILQGITAGGTIKQEASGVFIDTKRTKALNILASDGWEVVTVIGVVGAEHMVYLRRKLNH